MTQRIDLSDILRDANRHLFKLMKMVYNRVYDKSLTKEQAIFYIKEFIRNRPTSPTLEEIRKHFGYDSLTLYRKQLCL